jgi:16S rRNA (guanine527-N7)-methyltransferase
MSPDDPPGQKREPGTIARKLNDLLVQAGQPELPTVAATRFEAYLRVLQRWNARTNLTAVREDEGILRRHFLESIICARAIPSGVATLLDFGSGAGFPGIPIALCRPEITVTLAESQGKKAAFLREAARVLEIPVHVHGGRAETLAQTFDCVTLRAVDRMGKAVGQAAGLVSQAGWLAPFTAEAEIPQIQSIAGEPFTWAEPLRLPGGYERVLLIGQRAV